MAHPDEYETISWFQVGYSRHAMHRHEPWVVAEVSLKNTQSLFTAQMEVVSHHSTRADAMAMATEFEDR